MAALVHAAILMLALSLATAEEVVVQRGGGHQPQEAQQRPRNPAQRDVESRHEGQGAPLRQRPQVDAPPPAARVQQGPLQPVIVMVLSEVCCRDTRQTSGGLHDCRFQAMLQMQQTQDVI